ncbi:MAG: (2E,6E)-farnesyl diphosphate synthase [bacterium ADurb.Bin400]|nr:MAG: (2E,6E)-farnesyl diphosphate synthase [bacterium ADurb.Bin400]
MDAKAQLHSFKEILDDELKLYFDKKIEDAYHTSPIAEELINRISELTLRGGKRIRAALLYHSYLAHGGNNKTAAIKAAMAMELSETFLLIHDDIMDNSDLRRGGLTIHASYRETNKDRIKSPSSLKNFSDSVALNAGDTACAMSYEIISTADFEPRFIARALAELSRVYILETYGQTLDMVLQYRDQVTTHDALLVQELKTVPYTFDGPLKIGAILAGADDDSVALLSEYSVPLGVAFQIQDDILGMYGTEEKLGKPVTSDLREGKKTLLILDALEKANGKQRDIIEKSLGNPKATFSDLENVRKVLEETGSLNQSKELASRLVQRSLNVINQLRLKNEGKEFLVGITEYMINREY